MKFKTQKLIRKVKLKPKGSESVYSQAFIDRERSMIKVIMDTTDKQIKMKKSLEHNKKLEFFNYSNDVIKKRLGLFKKPT